LSQLSIWPTLTPPLHQIAYDYDDLAVKAAIRAMDEVNHIINEKIGPDSPKSTVAEAGEFTHAFFWLAAMH
jgi:hypothetical protein